VFPSVTVIVAEGFLLKILFKKSVLSIILKGKNIK